MTETPLDTAHAAMEAAPEDASARMGFYARLADTELFLMLTTEARDDVVSPELFDLGDAQFVLAFDTEDRLATFAGRAVPYAAISGRGLASMLAGQATGLALNLEVAPSSILIPPEGVDWLTETLGQTAPDEAQDRAVSFSAPKGVPDTVLTALDAKLAQTGGFAKRACLATVEYDSGAQGHILAFIDAIEDARPALAKAVQEALTFSGIEAGALDVAFFEADSPTAERLLRVGLAIDLPEPPKPETPVRIAPGSDPDKPPKLR